MDRIRTAFDSPTAAEEAAFEAASAALLTSDNWGDIVDLGRGNDVINAGSGNDIVFGGAGNDQLRGDDGIDVLIGESGNDVLRGGNDDDYLLGGSGNDVLDGGDGDDYMGGGTGNDVYKVDSLGDTVVEEADEGNDTIVWNVNAKLDLTTLPNIENAELGANGTDLTGNAADNELIGNDSANTITGLAGNDHIEGRGGSDLLIGDDGPDGNDTIHGGEGDDTIWGDNKDDLNNPGHDDSSAVDDEDMLYGDAGEDEIHGGSGDDVLDGGADADELHAGRGEDVVFGGNGGDDDTIFLDGGNGTFADARDDFVDIVVAASSFAENGTDTVRFYGDGIFNSLAVDIVDFSAALGFADGAVDDATELLGMLHFDEASSEIRDTGADLAIGGGDDNTWFVIDELGNNNVAESVTVQVDGQVFTWDAAADVWVI